MHGKTKKVAVAFALFAVALLAYVSVRSGTLTIGNSQSQAGGGEFAQGAVLKLENLTKPGNLSNISNGKTRLQFTVSADARLRSYVICPTRAGYCLEKNSNGTNLVTNEKGVGQVTFTVDELRYLTRYTQDGDKKYEFRASVMSQNDNSYLQSNTVAFTVSGKLTRRIPTSY